MESNREKWARVKDACNKQRREKYAIDKSQKERYNSTMFGRAVYLNSAYRYKDRKYNRGEGDITPQWIVDNIFNKPCHYCGETDWRKMGCDRIDNSLPHNADNVVPCCKDCNNQRHRSKYEYFYMIVSINRRMRDSLMNLYNVDMPLYM